MDTSAPSPRVNGELMGRFVGKKVLLVGKNEGSDGSTMTVRTPDEKTVTVQLAPGSPAPATAFVEFEGIVDGAAANPSSGASPSCPASASSLPAS